MNRLNSYKFITFSGIGLLAILFFAVNIVADDALENSRLDLTENGLYTLSDGTRNVLSGLEEDITMQLYYSASLAGSVPEIRNHADRVMSMLEEFRSISGGRIRLELIDPEPFSEDEDSAVDAGLSGVPLGAGGDTFYFGLVGQNTTDDQETIPFFQPERSRFLEYDLTRMVYGLSNPDLPKLMVITTFPLDFGPGGVQAAMRGESRPYAITQPLRGFFDVDIPLRQWEEIPADTDVIMLAHARNLTERQRYAIDQFILGGGKALILADAFSEVGVRLPSPGGAPDPLDPHSSLLPELLGPWGVQVEPETLVVDRTLATRVNIGRGRRQLIDYVAWIQAAGPALNADDPVTADLSLPLLLPSVGHIEIAEDSPLKAVPLITTTREAMRIPASKLRFRPDPQGLLAEFKSEDRQFVIAARLNGIVNSTFDAAPEGVDAPHVERSAEPVSLILVSDADFIEDTYWANRQAVFGQEVTQQTSGNANFLINAIDNLAGSSDLIGLRSRGEGDRPFTVIAELRRAAEQQYLQQEQELEARLKDTEKKLAELQNRAGEGGGQLLSSEEATAIESFQKDVLDTRRQLRAVQLNLRRDIEELQDRIKVITIGAMPALVFVIAMILALWRRGRRRRSQMLKEA